MVRPPPSNPSHRNYPSKPRKTTVAVAACPSCGQSWRVDPGKRALTCGECGHVFTASGETRRGHVQRATRSRDVPGRDEFVSRKVAAGVCGILLGGFGVHKFIVGLPGPGAIVLVFNVLSIGTGICCIFPLLGSTALSILGIVEGVLYLSKSEDDFYRHYAIERRWFF